MKLFDTIYKRKSAMITAVIMILILLIVFFFGLKYMDPPIETGITVNFGTSQVGRGLIQPKTPIKTKVAPEVVEEETIEEVVEEIEESLPEDNAPSEEAITQELEESIRLKKIEKEKREADEAEELERIREEAVAKAEAERVKAEAKAKAEVEKIQKEKDDKRQKLDALMGGLNNNEGTNTKGQGNDNIGGDKGKVTGDLNASGYYGNGGNGGNGNYQLGNRKPLNRPKPNYECEEEGLVIVTIEVNRAGKVIKATPGTKGSTNTAACLLSQAKKAALKTIWEPDDNAGIKQIGIIKYRFSLTN